MIIIELRFGNLQYKDLCIELNTLHGKCSASIYVIYNYYIIFIHSVPNE